MGDEVELTKHQEQEFKKMFGVYDKDKDGKLSSTELVHTIRALALTPNEREVAAMVKEVDENGDGTVDFDEFLSYAVRMLPEEDPEVTLRQAFIAWDKDETGFMLADDLRSAMLGLGDILPEEEIEEFMKEAHPSTDGRINYEDFITKLLKDYK